MARGGSEGVEGRTTSSSKQISVAFGGLRPGGRLINMGLPDGPISVDPMALIFGQREVRGSTQDERKDLFDVLALVASKKVTPKIETPPCLRCRNFPPKARSYRPHRLSRLSSRPSTRRRHGCASQLRSLHSQGFAAERCGHSKHASFLSVTT
jgi:hypothetical protein